MKLMPFRNRIRIMGVCRQSEDLKRIGSAWGSSVPEDANSFDSIGKCLARRCLENNFDVWDESSVLSANKYNETMKNSCYKLLLAAMLAPHLWAEAVTPQTFCNPMPIPDMPVGIECWKFNEGDVIPKDKLAPWAWGCWRGPKDGPKYAHQFRELADPEIHLWNGAWYLYPSCGLLWKSTDCGGTWQHVKAIEHNPHYAPTVAKFRGKYYLNEAYASLKVADSPEGPFTDLGRFDLKSFLSSEEPTIDFGDPMLFADGDRLYIYLGCVPKEKCLWGTELDPENPRRALRPVKRIVSLDAKERPWMCSPLEGAYVFRRGDTYYFTHAGNSPVKHAYCTSVWKGPTPLGPFVPQANNPVFSRAEGCARGGGHGGIFQDERGDWWTCYTIWPGGKFHAFERFIGLDRIEFDANGDIVPATPTDEPQWLPSTGRKGATGWKKLPVKTQAKGAADDELRTYAKFPAGTPAMEFAFDKVQDIRAFRVIWCDLGLDVHRGVKGGAYRYRVERRENGMWTTWFDASRNGRDLTVDYREAPAARSDAVRLVLLDAPKGITPAVTEFTVFGHLVNENRQPNGVVSGGTMVSDSPVKVSVDPSRVVAHVPRTLYGTGMEDVNHEIYGGLDAQCLYDESFEEQEIEPVGGLGIRPKPMWVCGRQWTVTTTGNAQVTVDRREPHLGAVSVALEPGSGLASVANAGLNGWGVSCRAGRAMDGWLFAKGRVGSVAVALRRRKDGFVYAAQPLELRQTDVWQRLGFSLVPDATDPAAEFVISANGKGRLLIDDAYLADRPTNEFGRLGCREDIVDGFRKEGLTFLRWGGSMANSWGYLWKNMTGDRRPYDGFWFRTSSTGFLYKEFVQMANAMKLPCAFSIYAYEQLAKTVQIAEWLKRFEGDVYVQIGNEECAGCTPTCGEFSIGDCRRYCESLKLIVTEMRKVNPRLKFVSALMFNSSHQDVMDEGFRLTDGYVDYWDMHLQLFGPDVTKVVDAQRREFAAFHDMIKRLNPKTKMKLAIFEENGNEHGLRRALAHAGVLGLCREEGDFLLTSCPANALQPYLQNDNGWDQGQVFFTPDKVWLQPCGWAQQMASANHRDLLVSGTSSDAQVLVSATRSSDGNSLVLHLVNAEAKQKSVSLVLADAANWKVEKVTVLAGDGPLAENTPEAPDRISPQDDTEAFKASSILRPYSYTVMVLAR